MCVGRATFRPRHISRYDRLPARQNIIPTSILPPTLINPQPPTIDYSMADPLSIVASIAGLLTLGVQVSTGLAQIISDAKAADSLLTELTTDLLVLYEILSKLKLLSRWRESGSDHLVPITLERCHESLKEAQAIIVMIQESIAKGGLQKHWVQITWSGKQKQIAAISAKISEQRSILMLTLQMQNAYANSCIQYS